MDPLNEAISIDPSEATELLFKVKVDGVDQAPVRVRLVCEAGNVAYMFTGTPKGDDVVQFELPAFSDKLQEGSYPSRVEVLVGSRYFVPVKFDLQLKVPVRVVAESVNRAPGREVTVSAVPIRGPSTLKERYQAKRGRAHHGT